MTTRSALTALALTACSSPSPYAVPALVNTDGEVLELAGDYTRPPIPSRVTIENPSSDTLFVTFSGFTGDAAPLLLTSLDAVTEVFPNQRRVFDVWIANEPWSWTSGTLDGEMELEVGYFFDGQLPGEGATVSESEAPLYISQVYTVPLTVTLSCDLDEDGADSVACFQDDCDDDDNNISPGADETCNGVDDNCDGLIDVGASNASTWYLDADHDDFGGDLNIEACDPPHHSWTEVSGDCDDGEPEVHPDHMEICGDGVDNDCLDGDEPCPSAANGGSP